MSTEPFIGEIKALGFYFAPLSYMTCSGQLLSIAQYTPLFSLLGTNFGGDGQVTFALPDLRGRVPIGQGQGPGFPNYTIGESAGSPTATMTSLNMPLHLHTLNGVNVRLLASTDNADEQAHRELMTFYASIHIPPVDFAYRLGFIGGWLYAAKQCHKLPVALVI